MNLYQWRSELLREYARGFIIVHAETIEEARSKIKGKAFEWLKENKFYNFDNELGNDDEELMKEYLETLDKDLAKDPEIMDVIFIKGSE